MSSPYWPASTPQVLVKLVSTRRAAPSPRHLLGLPASISPSSLAPHYLLPFHTFQVVFNVQKGKIINGATALTLRLPVLFRVVCGKRMLKKKFFPNKEYPVMHSNANFIVVKLKVSHLGKKNIYILTVSTTSKKL